MPYGEVGELIIRGPQVMKGYWNNEKETREVLRDGWLYTSDLATMDESGYVFIVDRKKDLVISNGYNIYPREIEEVLYEHPKVHDAAAIGVPHPKRGEAVKIFIVPKSGEVLNRQEILDWCREKLAPYKVPSEVEFRDSLPKNLWWARCSGGSCETRARSINHKDLIQWSVHLLPFPRSENGSCSRQPPISFSC